MGIAGYLRHPTRHVDSLFVAVFDAVRVNANRILRRTIGQPYFIGLTLFLSFLSFAPMGGK